MSDVKEPPPQPPPSYEPPSYEETTRPNAIPNPSPAEPHKIAIDKNLIYPAVPSARALYELDHELDAGFKKISISHLDSKSAGGRGNPRARLIYEFTQAIFSQDVEISGKKQSSLSGSLILRPTRPGFRKYGWELSRTAPSALKAETIFRIRPTRLRNEDTLYWESADHSLVGIETLWKPGVPNSRPLLHIVGDIGDVLTHALVTAWCARIWVGRQTVLANERDKTLGSGTYPLPPICRLYAVHSNRTLFLVTQTLANVPSPRRFY